MPEMAFDRTKFAELIVYIAEKTADDPTFGDTKLNKVLYWSDFFAYSHLGHPITGAEYQKGEWGPTARLLLLVRADLEARGAVSVEERPAGTKKRKMTVPHRHADTELFSDEELALVDHIIAQVEGKTAASVSRASHEQSVGWNLVELGEEIPYRTALICDDPPSEETLARGREVAAQLGW